MGMDLFACKGGDRPKKKRAAHPVRMQTARLHEWLADQAA